MKLRSRLLVFIIPVCCTTAVQAASKEQIANAVNRAREALYKLQEHGLWESGPFTRDDQGGQTAIATYALLAAGENPQSPKLTKAIEFLKKLKSQNVYVLGVRAQIWNYLGDPKREYKGIQEDADQLVNLIRSKGPARGLFHYPNTPPDEYDHSISQYGVLGLWALEEDGAEVGGRAWEVMDAAWRGHEDSDGGWSYIRDEPSDEGDKTESMTCAGVATLFITDNYVHGADARNASENSKDKNIDRGLQWIADKFNRTVADVNPRDTAVRYYLFYGVQRIGVAAGVKYLGKINWFEQLSDYLVTHQNPDGTWGKPDELFGQNGRDIPSTSFALLFLTFGDAPVVMNKLSYNSAPHGKQPASNWWNARPRDVYNMTRWVGRQNECSVRWNIVDLAAPISDLLEAPTTFITGSEPIALNDAEAGKLREYIDQGGMVIANADHGSKLFSDSFKALMQKLYPAYQFRDLPLTHPIFTSEQFHAHSWPNKPHLLGISNGVRELAVLIPEQDPSRVWQVPYQGSLPPYALGADLIGYSAERHGIREHRPDFFVQLDNKIAPDRSLRVARIRYSGNWDPEPGGWRRIAAIVHNHNKLDLQIDAVDLGKGVLNPGTDKFAALTGTAATAFTAAQWKELVNYVHGGGTLLIDAAGGSTAFAESMESGMKAAFGADAGQLSNPLAPGDPRYPAFPEGTLYRVYARTILGNLHTPQVRAIKIGGRTALYYSREDLSHGMLGTDVDGVIGYTPAVATAIVRAMLLAVSPSPGK